MANKILTGLLALVFVAAGVMKLFGLGSAVTEFEHLGYSNWFRMFIGGAEIAGGIGLLIPGLATAATIGLEIIMIGAVWTLRSTDQSPAPPLIVGALLAVREVLARRGGSV